MVEAQRIEAPAPGIYRGIDFDTYASWDAANASLLNLFARTPEHARHELLHGSASTRALDLGWLTHLAVLEPERFAAEVAVPPKIENKRTKAGKAAWARFSAAHAEHYIVDEPDYQAARAMRDKLLSHPTARELLTSPGGATEISIIWQDEGTGLPCKARIDRVGTVGGCPIVADLKTARSAQRRTFEKAIHEHGYHVQAAHYLAGLRALVPVPAGNQERRFVVVVVESAPPYCVALYELDEVAVDVGERERRRYLRTYQQCLESGEWPGYGEGIDYASLPAWALRAWGEE